MVPVIQNNNIFEIIIDFCVQDSVFLCVCYGLLFPPNRGITLDIRTLRQLYEEGILLSATAMAVSSDEELWELEFEKRSGGVEKITKARSDEPKIYKRINGALADARSIGFSKIQIDFGE